MEDYLRDEKHLQIVHWVAGWKELFLHADRDNRLLIEDKETSFVRRMKTSHEQECAAKNGRRKF